ncbi:transaldolase [Hahella sp. CCB-MM4]|uniref:transaldolase n=1 Tax=Hahella sp. (strain CCB-MM4) TaxID=1926491 RepID=UPI000B9B6423|nr:transaldolase [Hahella sp. CCB-MM4]OZG74169.1 transaldolase [Hahella sp. CCB-MM4]
MNSLLEQLKQFSTVVADTGDIDAIRCYEPEDATTNPSLILKAVQSGKYDALLEQILAGLSPSIPREHLVEEVCDRLIVAMGTRILEEVPGRVSTEVNARLSFDREGSLAKARKLVRLYEMAGVSRDRILIKLAATWEGIQAAEILESEGIQCNLTLIFSFAQARACAEAGVYLISPFVGRILDWHRKAQPERSFEPAEEPGVLSVQRIYEYFRQHQYPTVVMGASFRNTGEILALSGCDRLTISPALLEELASQHGNLDRVLKHEQKVEQRPEPLKEEEFRWQLNEDAMATEKLAEGIRGFEHDQRLLEDILTDRIQAAMLSAAQIV